MDGAVQHPFGTLLRMTRVASRDRAPFVAQGTWRSGALHVWGWNGDGPASAAWLYSGFGNSWDAQGQANRGWHDSPVSYGELSKLALELPGGGQRSVSTVRLDPFGAAVWLSDTPAGEALSPSLAWFAALTRFAVDLVRTGHVTPVVADEGPFTAARWVPVLDAATHDAVAHAASVAPAICRNGTDAGTESILAMLVDGFARAVLHHGGWTPELGRRRSADVQALRAVFAALAKPDPVVREGTADFHDALGDLTVALDRHRRRLAGEPVVRGRVRLTLPDDALDPWLVELELADDADPGRWCTADDVWARAPRALDLAGVTAPEPDPDTESALPDEPGGNVISLAARRAAKAGGAAASAGHFDQLTDEVLGLAATVAEAVPVLADLALEHEPAGIELDLEAAADFLDMAPAELAARGIELLGPEHLVRARVRVRGEAREAPADDRKQRFGKEALVEWSAVVDDTPITAADLERAEAARVAAEEALRNVRERQDIARAEAALRRAAVRLRVGRARRMRGQERPAG